MGTRAPLRTIDTVNTVLYIELHRVAVGFAPGQPFARQIDEPKGSPAIPAKLAIAEP
jgi:hypothetical protein